MAQARVLILRTAGTNCDWETQFAFEKAGARAERVHINRVVEEEKRLEDYQILAVPGGFSYGDDLGAGKVLANELLSRAKEHFASFAERDHLIIGICNGFQILVKMNLLPGFDGIEGEQAATLTTNDSGRFEDRWVYLRPDSDKSPFIGKGEVFYLPVAHGEGKFVTRDEAALKKIRDNEQIVFRYVTKEGKKPAYPDNPNGSYDDIAGICDTTGRILGMMPHPERHITKEQHPRWTRGEAPAVPDGLKIIENAVKYFE
jgi:phosphoribosylformylglycinamidine synthase